MGMPRTDTGFIGTTPAGIKQPPFLLKVVGALTTLLVPFLVELVWFVYIAAVLSRRNNARHYKKTFERFCGFISRS